MLKYPTTISATDDNSVDNFADVLSISDQSKNKFIKIKLPKINVEIKPNIA